ncbi:hypothetical protein PVAG01_04239 [Phlyctema vagabunda]|uniref:Uncharacterized protein n=1 Tax=Phlyctema vagabunda TaxID=108571 RepID=A0ABR4PP18_9HELO
MPFNELQRHESWPPTIIRLQDEEEHVENIDEDPFSFFLTPEDFDEDMEDFSAGIESDTPDPEVRTVSPSSLQRAQAEEDDDVSFGVAMPLSLRDFTNAHAKRRQREEEHRIPRVERPRIINANPKSSLKARRGRANVRLTPLRSGRTRGQTRSLSARRAQSWREPSPDIWSIEEELEIDDGENKAISKEDQKNLTSPSAESQPMAIPKPKKHVHWAF